MPHNWWTRKNLVLAAAVVALAFIGFIVIGVSYPEPEEERELTLEDLKSPPPEYAELPGPTEEELADARESALPAEPTISAQPTSPSSVVALTKIQGRQPASQ